MSDLLIQGKNYNASGYPPVVAKASAVVLAMQSRMDASVQFAGNWYLYFDNAGVGWGMTTEASVVDKLTSQIPFVTLSEHGISRILYRADSPAVVGCLPRHNKLHVQLTSGHLLVVHVSDSLKESTYVKLAKAILGGQALDPELAKDIVHVVLDTHSMG